MSTSWIYIWNYIYNEFAEVISGSSKQKIGWNFLHFVLSLAAFFAKLVLSWIGLPPSLGKSSLHRSLPCDEKVFSEQLLAISFIHVFCALLYLKHRYLYLTYLSRTYLTYLFKLKFFIQIQSIKLSDWLATKTTDSEKNYFGAGIF